MAGLKRPYIAIWAICLALFNVLVFTIPGIALNGSSFWLGYAAITLAFVGQLVCMYLAFAVGDAGRRFLGISLAMVGYVGLIAMLVIGGTTMLVPQFPLWLGIVLCFVALGVTAIFVIAAKATGTAVHDIGKGVDRSTFTIRSLAADAEHLVHDANTPELKADATRVYEALRYSDPVSNVSLYEVNERMQRQLAAFADAVKSGDADLSHAEAEELLSLIDERNKKCRFAK